MQIYLTIIVEIVKAEQELVAVGLHLVGVVAMFAVLTHIHVAPIQMAPKRAAEIISIVVVVVAILVVLVPIMFAVK